MFLKNKSELAPGFLLAIVPIMVCCWLWLVGSLFICPVWDEQHIINWLQNRSTDPSSNWLLETWFSDLPYRPLVKSVVLPFLLSMEDKTEAWKVLRIFNTGLILLSLVFYLGFLKNTVHPRSHESALVAFAVLFSPSALIVATWGANMFDASALLAISVGLWLLSANHPIAAAIAFGAGFFCKEITALIFVFFVYWTVSGKISGREAVKPVFIMLVFFAAYMILRSRIVSLGGPGDIHGFDITLFPEGLLRYTETAWMQVGWAPPYMGLGIFILFCWLMRASVKAVLAAVFLIICCALIYLGMIHRGEAPAITFVVFQPRLYLIPAILLITIFLLNIRAAVVIGLILPLHISGLVLGYNHYEKFQHSFKKIESVSRDQKRELRIWSDSPGVQSIVWRNKGVKYRIVAGNFSNAQNPDYILNCRTGDLETVPPEFQHGARVDLEILEKPLNVHNFGGFLDNVSVKNNRLILQGWIPLNPMDKGKKILLYLPGEPLNLVHNLQVRDDVARVLKNQSMRYSGFFLIMEFESNRRARMAADNPGIYARSDTHPLVLLQNQKTEN